MNIHQDVNQVINHTKYQLEINSQSDGSVKDFICSAEVGCKIRKTKKKLLLDQRVEERIPKILNALNLVNKEDAILIPAKQKASPRTNTNSSRRSSYIGVFKNGPNWQALISIKRKKTYIGTYKTEEEAARAFDYYSILINNMVAVTNFNYSKRTILQLFSEHKKSE
jgi:hypothetical protein